MFLLGLLFKILSVLFHYCFQKIIFYYLSTNSNEDIQGPETFHNDVGVLRQATSYIQKDNSQECILGHEETLFPYVYDDYSKNQDGEMVMCPTTFSDGDLAWKQNSNDDLEVPSKDNSLMKNSRFEDVNSIDSENNKNRKKMNQYRVVTGVIAKDHPLKISFPGFGCVSAEQSEINLLDLNEPSIGNLIEIEEFCSERNEVCGSKIFQRKDFLNEPCEDCLKDLGYKEKLETSEKLDSSDEMKDFNLKIKNIVGDEINISSNNKGSTEDLKVLINRLNEIIDGKKVVEIVNGKLVYNDVNESKVDRSGSVSKIDSAISDESVIPKEPQVLKQNNYLINKPVFNFTSEDGKAIKNKLKRLFPPKSMSKVFNRPFSKKSESDSELKTVSTTRKNVGPKHHMWSESPMENDTKSDSEKSEFFAFTPSKWKDENKDLEYAGLKLESSQKKNVPQCDSNQNGSLEFTPFKWTDDVLKLEDNPVDIQKNMSNDKLESQWACFSDCEVLKADSKPNSPFDGFEIPHPKQNRGLEATCNQRSINSHDIMEGNKEESDFKLGSTAKKEPTKQKRRADISQGTGSMEPTSHQRKLNGKDSNEDISKFPPDYDVGKRALEDSDLLLVYPLSKGTDDNGQHSKDSSLKALEENKRDEVFELDEKKKSIDNFYEKYMLSSSDNENNFNSR